MTKCNKCDETITWGDHYVKGDKPKNIDGSSHYCKGKSTENFAENFKSAPRVEVPIEQIVAEITAIQGTISEEAWGTPENIEGKWKFAISRKMSR